MDIFGDFTFGNEPRNSPNVISLFNAASRNQLDKLNDILNKNPCIKFAEEVNGFNCFLIASKKGHLNVVKRIHELFPEIITSRTSDNQRSSLMLAAFEGHEYLVEYLTKYEISGSVDALGNNALHYASWGGRLSIVKSLIANNFDPSAKNEEGLSAIQFATAGKHIDIVQYLSDLNFGSLVTESSDAGYNSLHRAAIYGSLDTIKLLLVSTKNETAATSSLSVESRAFNGNSVLHLAAQHGGLDIVQYLVEVSGATVNVQNDYDLTPLHFACIGGHTVIVQYLIQHGADTLILNSSGSSALHLAAASGHHSICTILSQQRGVQLLGLDTEGHSPVDVALSAGYKELAGKIALWSCIKMRATKLLALMNETRE